MTSPHDDVTRQAPSPRRWRSSLLSGASAEWRSLIENKSLLVVLAFLPLLYATTVAFLYQHESVVDAPVIVVDQDESQVSRRMTWLIDATEEVQVVDRMQSVDVAFARMRRHETSAVVLIPEGFEARLLSTQPAKMKLWIDSANLLTYSTAYTGIRAAITELDDEQARKAFMARGTTRRLAQQRTSPIELTERLLFLPTASYGAFLAPAVFVVALQQAILLGFALSVGMRREQTGRIDADEPKAYLKLLGRYVVHLPFHLSSAAVLSWLIHYWYQFPTGSAFGTFVLLSVFVIAAGPFAILVSLPFTNGRTPMQVLMMVSTPLFFASGYTWPIREMPDAVQFVAKLIPTTPGLWGLRVAAMSSQRLELLRESLTFLAIQGTGYVIVGAVVVTLLGWRRESAHARHARTASVASPCLDEG
jgi:ABC-2 type transport system permease protein